MSRSTILAGARTPTGAFLGALSTVAAPQLGAVAIREALRRSGIGGPQVDEVIMGNVVGAGLGQAPARQAALGAGLPDTVAAVTINKVCGSGLKAVMMADQVIRCGDAGVVVAGGMESMSRAPHLAAGLRSGHKLGDITLTDAVVFDGLTCSFESCHMGSHAEYIAERFGITRADQDAYAVESQRRAQEAASAGRFQAEIAPVTVKKRREEIEVTADEGIRGDTTTEALSRLRTVFQSDGTVTAGNASTLADGAAAVVVTDAATAADSGAPWKAEIVASHTAGMAPKDLFIAPVAAIEGALKKADLHPNDIDLFEINEAFAAQMLACIRQLELDADRVNIYGGGISLGHPIGASGARTLVTLLAAMHDRDLRRGVVSLCLGGGNAVAMVVERV